MLLDVKFRYPVKVIPYQKRKYVSTHYRDSTPVLIRELEDVEAPVAFRYVDPNQHAWDKNNIPDAARLDVRAVDGALYEPYCYQSGANSEWVRLDAGFLKAAAAEDVEKETGYSADVFGTSTKRWRTEDDKPEDFPRSRHISDERKAVIDAINAKADRLLLIDGTLYRRTTEPVYTLRGNYLSVQRLSRAQTDQSRYTALYRADELEQIHEGYRRDMSELSTIEVLDPAAITYRGPALALFEVASSVLENLKSGLAEASVAQFARYAAFRDVVLAAESSGTTAEDATVQAIVPLLDEIRKHDMDPDNYNQRRIAEVTERLDAAALRSLDLSAHGFRP